MASRRAKPRTGDPRMTLQPLKIDRLPPSVHEAILVLRNQQGKTWQEIEDLSALPVAEKKGGFIDWEKLPTAVLELFPEMRLPHTSLHRWYDLRVQQVQRQVMESAEQARVIAQAFVKSTVKGDKQAVLNAARDLIMSVISEDATSGGKRDAAKALISLAEIMQSDRANDIKERKVATEERKIKLVEDRERILREKLQREAAELERKRSSGELRPEDIARLVEQTFGISPKAHSQAA